MPLKAANADPSGDDRTADVVTNISLDRYNGKSTDPLVASEFLRFGFLWDASRFAGTDQALHVGDYIRVVLPDWAKFPNSEAVMSDDLGRTVANCTQGIDDPKILTCEFTTFVDENPQNLKGRYSTALQLVETSTPVTTPLTVADSSITLTSIGTLPDDGKVTASKKTPLKDDPPPSKESKAGVILGNSDGYVHLRWAIYVFGTGEDLVIEDLLQKPQKVDFEVKPMPYARSRDANEDAGNWNLETDLAPGTARLEPMVQFESEVLNAGEPNEQASVTITVPDSEVGRVYQLVFYTRIATDAYSDGDTISNVATVNSRELTSNVEARYFTSASASGDPSRGGVQIFKTVLHSNGTSLDPEAEYSFEVTWTDESGEHSEVLTAKAGESASIANLLKGTVVHIKEIAPEGGTDYAWAPVEYGAGRYGDSRLDNVTSDADGIDVVISGGRITSVNVTNDVVPGAPFKLKKVVEGLDDDALADSSFEVIYSCNADSLNGEIEANTEATLSVSANGDVDSPLFPVGTSCHLVNERDASKPGYEWTSSISQDAFVIAEAGAQTVIEVVNTYAPVTVSRVVAKVVQTADDIDSQTAEALKDRTYTGSFECVKDTEPVRQGTFEITNGETFTVDDLPEGTECHFVEDTDAVDQKFAYSDDAITDVTVTDETPGQLINSFVAVVESTTSEEPTPSEEVTTSEVPSTTEVTTSDEEPTTSEESTTTETTTTVVEPSMSEVTTSEQEPSSKESTTSVLVPPTTEATTSEESPSTSESTTSEVEPTTSKISTSQEKPTTTEMTTSEEPTTSETTSTVVGSSSSEVSTTEEVPTSSEITTSEVVPPTTEPSTSIVTSTIPEITTTSGKTSSVPPVNLPRPAGSTGIPWWAVLVPFVPLVVGMTGAMVSSETEAPVVTPESNPHETVRPQLAQTGANTGIMFVLALLVMAFGAGLIGYRKGSFI